MPAFLVASYDQDSKPNVMTVAWGGIVNSEPPYIGVSIRHHRWTYEGIEKHQAFTVNIPKTSQAQETDYVGIFSGKTHDKLAKAGLTAVKSDLVEAPYLQECPLVLECKVDKYLDLGTHRLYVGLILDVKVNENALTDGKIDIRKVDPLIFGPNQDYYQIGDFVAKAFSVGKSLK